MFVLASLDELIHALLEIHQCLGYGCIECYHGRGAVGLTAGCTELKAVSGEGERAGAVAVGIVYQQLGHRRDVEAQT